MAWDRYAATWADQHHGYDPRRAPATVRGWLRLGYAAARVLAALRVRPATVTRVGVALSFAVPLVTGRGPAGLLAAAGLVLLASLASTVDQALGVLDTPALRRAAIWQAAAARLGEAAWLVGLWVAGVPGLLAVACGALTGLHELVRVQALATGTSQLGAQTVAERPMRVAVVAVGLTVAGLAGRASEQLAAGALTVATAVWLVLALLGFGQLAGIVRKSLN